VLLECLPKDMRRASIDTAFHHLFNIVLAGVVPFRRVFRESRSCHKDNEHARASMLGFTALLYSLNGNLGMELLLTDDVVVMKTSVVHRSFANLWTNIHDNWQVNQEPKDGLALFAGSLDQSLEEGHLTGCICGPDIRARSVIHRVRSRNGRFNDVVVRYLQIIRMLQRKGRWVGRGVSPRRLVSKKQGSMGELCASNVDRYWWLGLYDVVHVCAARICIFA
jgi:hypothetical protein